MAVSREELVALVLGAVLVVGGVASISWQIGVVIAGVMLIFAACVSSGDGDG